MKDLYNLLDTIWSAASPYTGVLIVIVLTIVLVRVFKIIFRKKQAEPYYNQLASLLIVNFGMFLLVLFLPISNDMKKQILSIIGLLLSAVVALSSTSLIGNAMAGIMLRISKSYRPGDFIEVENTRGRVYNHGLFSTEVQIITRDTVSFPNMYLIQHPIRVTRADGSFISTSVSLGYDVPRHKVEETLIKAAEKTELEEPFVYIEELFDHAVEYRVFGLLKETEKMLSLKSELRKNLLDVLHRNNIEIVSPSFMTRREVEKDKSFIPPVSDEQPAPKKKGAEVEDIAFDKAEEAENIEKLKEKYEKLISEKEELSEKLKEENDKEKKEEIKNRTVHLEKKAEVLSEQIEKKQKEKAENK